MNPQHLVVLGGAGFVGSHLLPRLVADGHRVTALSRNRERRRALAVLPGVRIASVDVHDPAALRRALEGADAAINLVGIRAPRGAQTFKRVHVELVRELIAACRDAGVPRLHHVSALKAGQGLSKYLKTRGEGEALVKAAPLDWTIYQPGLTFGEGDALVTRFATLLRRVPLLPIARAQSRIAPCHVDDLVEAITRCVATPALGRRQSFELYGPEVLSFGDMIRAIGRAAGVRTPILPLPDGLGRLEAQLAELLPGKPFTLDEFRSLRTDAVGKQDGFAALGIVPQPFTPWLPRLVNDPPRQPRLDRTRREWRHS